MTSIIEDLISGVVDGITREILKKPRRTKRTRRRTASPSGPTATERLRQIEKLLKPPRKQTSRKRTVRARSKTRRRSY